MTKQPQFLAPIDDDLQDFVYSELNVGGPAMVSEIEGLESSDVADSEIGLSTSEEIAGEAELAIDPMDSDDYYEEGDEELLDEDTLFADLDEMVAEFAQVAELGIVDASSTVAPGVVEEVVNGGDKTGHGAAQNQASGGVPSAMARTLAA